MSWRADRFGDPGEVLRLVDQPVPTATPGTVTIDVDGAGVSFADWLMCRGEYQTRPPVPFTPGTEACGTVRSVGVGVSTCWEGRRVMARATLPHGALAATCLAVPGNLVAVPPEIPDAASVALVSGYLTAYLALIERARLQAGESLAVVGASGAVGSAAVDLGAALGAVVIACARGDHRVSTSAALGAVHLIDTETLDPREAILECTGGKGADVILDPVGGSQTRALLGALAWGGRLLVVGFTTAGIPELAANRLLLRNSAVMGVNAGAYRERRPVLVAQAYADLIHLYLAGSIRPLIDRIVGLDDAVSCYQDLARRQIIGKAVIRPRAAHHH